MKFFQYPLILMNLGFVRKYFCLNPFAFLSLLAVGGVILILVEFWYLFLIGGVGYASYRVYNEKK